MAARKDDVAASQVSWVFAVAVKDGQAGALKALVGEMADVCQANEPETLIYEWTISEDLKTAEVHERYADSEAALRHLKSFNRDFADRLMTLVAPTGMIVCGSPSEKLKEVLTGAPPTYMKVIGGFVR